MNDGNTIFGHVPWQNHFFWIPCFLDLNVFFLLIDFILQHNCFIDVYLCHGTTLFLFVFYFHFLFYFILSHMHYGLFGHGPWKYPVFIDIHYTIEVHFYLFSCVFIYWLCNLYFFIIGFICTFTIFLQCFPCTLSPPPPPPPCTLPLPWYYLDLFYFNLFVVFYFILFVVVFLIIYLSLCLFLFFPFCTFSTHLPWYIWMFIMEILCFF